MPNGLHPKDQHRPCESVAEQRVYTALTKGLPEGWSAWHSLRIRSSEGLLGEGDFVLADPARGLLVLEVKGGRIEQRDGRWFQNGQLMPKSPLEQATGFAHRLAARLGESGYRPPGFGAAVCFPDAEFVAAPSQDDLRGVVIGARELPWLGAALPKLMDAAMPSPRAATGAWIPALHRLWGETWIPHVPLGRRADDLAGQRLRLDENQLGVLEGLLGNQRVLVSGVAGSGKTLLAAEAARRHAADGFRVLLVCFTRTLATCLRAQLQSDGVDVFTVSALARHVAEAGGTPFPLSPDAAFWRALSLRAAEQAAPGGDKGWSVVVVDEAQDLAEEDWLLVSAIAEGKRLWGFLDESQRFWPERQVPGGLFSASFRLPRARRCPPGIQALADGYFREPPDAAAIASALSDRTLGIVESPSRSALADKIGAEIDRLLGEGFALRDIAIVSVRGREASDSICRLTKLGRHELVDTDAPDMNDRLVADSFLRWKGLERPAVIVTDLPDGELPKRAVRMYVALTRSLVAARIAGTKEELRHDPMLRPLLKAR